MIFWNWLFGSKQTKQIVDQTKPIVPRNSIAVRRLAERRKVSVESLDLYDDSIIKELLLLGLILNNDGSCYIDDPEFI